MADWAGNDTGPANDVSSSPGADVGSSSASGSSSGSSSDFWSNPANTPAGREAAAMANTGLSSEYTSSSDPGRYAATATYDTSGQISGYTANPSAGVGGAAGEQARAIASAQASSQATSSNIALMEASLPGANVYNQMAIAINAARQPGATGASVQAAVNYYNNPTDITGRAGYTYISQLGDSGTQRLIGQGYSPMDSLNQQLQAAYKTPGLTDDRYYLNELSKANHNYVEASSGYHHWAMETNLPVAANPFEYTGDLALALEKGIGGKSGAQITTPTNLSVLSLPNGVSLQDAAWNLAKGEKYQVDFSQPISVIDKAATLGTMGVYGNLNSYSSTLGIISLQGQQDIAMRASKGAEWVVHPEMLARNPAQNMRALGYGIEYQSKPAQNMRALGYTGAVGSADAANVKGERVGISPSQVAASMEAAGYTGAVWSADAANVKGERVGITPTSPAGVEIAMAEGGLPKPFVSGGAGAFVAVTPNEQIASNLISGAKTAFVGMIPVLGPSLLMYMGIQSERARELESNKAIVAAGPYEIRRDATAYALEIPLIAGDVVAGVIPTYHGGMDIRFGEWQPGSDLLTAYGQNENPQVSATLAEQKSLDARLPAINTAIESSRQQDAAIGSYLVGKVNEKGEFSGTPSEYSTYKDMFQERSKNVDVVNAYSSDVKAFQQKAYESGVYLPKGEGYIINPEMSGRYGEASRISTKFSQSIDKVILGTDMNEVKWNAFEQSPSFQNAPNYIPESTVNMVALLGYANPVLGIATGFASTKIVAPIANTVLSPQYGEGLYRTVTNPERSLQTATQGLLLYVATAGIGELAAARLPAAGSIYSPISTEARVATAWQSPVLQGGIGATFIGKSVYDIQSNPQLTPAEQKKEYGGLTSSLYIMSLGAAYPEATVSAIRYGEVRFGEKEAYNRVVSVERTQIEYNPEVVSDIGYSEGMTTRQLRYETPSVSQDTFGASIINPVANRLFNLREVSYGLIPEATISNAGDFAARVNPRGGDITQVKAGTTTRYLDARITDSGAASGTLRIESVQSGGNIADLILQARNDARLFNADPTQMIPEYIASDLQMNPTRISQTRNLAAQTTPGTTLDELFNLQLPNSGGTPIVRNVVDAYPAMVSMNTRTTIGGQEGFFNAHRNLPDASTIVNAQGYSESGITLSNVNPMSRMMEFSRDYAGLNVPETEIVFAPNGMPLRAFEGEMGLSTGVGQAEAFINENFQRTGQTDYILMHTHPEYTLFATPEIIRAQSSVGFHYYEPSWDAYQASPLIQSIRNPLGRGGKLGEIYDQELLVRARYYGTTRLGLVDRSRPPTFASPGDIVAYEHQGAGTFSSEIKILSQEIASPEGIRSYYPSASKEWVGYDLQLMTNEDLLTRSTYASSGRIVERIETPDITNMMRREGGSLFPQQRSDALDRAMENSPLREYSWERPGVNPRQVVTPQPISPKSQIQTPIESISHSSIQRYSPQTQRSLTQRGTAYDLVSDSLPTPIAATSMTMAIPMVASPQLQRQQSPQTPRQQQMSPQLVSVIQPQVQNVIQERGFAYDTTGDIALNNEQSREQLKLNAFSVYNIQSPVILQLSEIASIQKSGQLQYQETTPIQKSGQVQVPIITTIPQIVITPKNPPPIIPIIPILPPLPGFPGGGGGGGGGGARNPWGPRHTEIFSYAPKNLKGLYGMPKGRTPAIKKRK